MRTWAIVGVLLVTGSLSDMTRAQGFAGWLPFRDDKEETFVLPPTSLGASAGEAAGPAQSASAAVMNSDNPHAAMSGVPSVVASGGTPPPTTSDMPEERTSFLPAIPWPKFQLPYFPKPQLPSLPTFPGRQQVDEAKNAWVTPGPTPATPSPWQAVKSGAAKVKESTANAWAKTVDVLTPGSQRAPQERTRVAQREEPPLWRRMFVPEETEGPQTVPEWMGQERIKP